MPQDTETATAPTLVYTRTDEAPQLAAASLLPVLRRFARAAGIAVEERDISLAGRILAAFPEAVSDAVSDDLARLGELVQRPEAVVVKLPNVSASLAQLMDAISELQGHGHALPDYPEDPQTDAERDAKARYDAVKGSAVNPVLREGNSDRRAPAAVKAHARANPHSMGAWSKDSKTRVLSMAEGDFRGSEASVTLTAAQAAGPVRIEHVSDGGTKVLKDGLRHSEGTILDGARMSAAALRAFLADSISEAERAGILWSIHLKATMMKVSDPILFGHALEVFLAPVFEKHGETLKRAGIDPDTGLGVMKERIAALPEGEAILAQIDETLAQRPPLYMVDSDRGITNLHVPSDVIIDASMPAVLRAGGKGWGPDGEPSDVACIIPDRTYAPIYQASVDFFRENGALDPATAGTVQNVGLMAGKAEEYGSHPTTFEIDAPGSVRVVTEGGDVLIEHAVEAGDIWRMAATKPEAVDNWVTLALARRKATGYETVFWLDETRAHDAELLKVVRPRLEAEGASDVKVMAPGPATTHALEAITKGESVIAVSGNVLRDYLTDLFPILELGTSAKMLSVVGLMNGGGLFETGAGGSAPKHVQQLVKENHLRWDSLGEFCAIAEALRHVAATSDAPRAAVMAEAADEAITRLLAEGRSPGRKVGQPDNRDSHVAFARFWAEALAAQSDDPDLAAEFAPLADGLSGAEEKIAEEMREGRGQPVDLGGYYLTDDAKAAAAMRPSATFNALIDG